MWLTVRNELRDWQTGGDEAERFFQLSAYPPSTLDLTFNMDASPTERYQGEEKILISIDIGTTMSSYPPHTRLSIRGLTDLFAGAVAYTHLFPGSVPQPR